MGRLPASLWRNFCRTSCTWFLSSAASVTCRISPAVKRFDDPPLRFFGQLVKVAGVREAPEHHLRLPHDLPVLRAPRHHDHHQPVGGQVLPVAKHQVAQVAHGEAVHEDHARLHLSGDGRLIGQQLQDVAVLQQEDVLVRHPRRARQFGVKEEMPMLPVDGHEERGRTRLSITLSSSAAAWPDTCTPAEAS